jgi:hypothetical protein
MSELDKLTRGLKEISLNKKLPDTNKKRKIERPTTVIIIDENGKRRRTIRSPTDLLGNLKLRGARKSNKLKKKKEVDILFFGKKKKSKRIFGLTPDQYTITTSTIPNAGNGAFANIFLPKGSVLGNYKGKRLSSQQYNRLRDQSYVWELSSRHGPIYIDGKNPKLSNWLRFLNDSRDRRVNVEPYQSHGNIFYRTIKNIKPGEEMFISYGDDYW